MVSHSGASNLTSDWRRINAMKNISLEHDPEKCRAVFRKDHAQSKSQSARAIRPNPIVL
jgi:hypothetical protein